MVEKSIQAISKVSQAAADLNRNMHALGDQAKSIDAFKALGGACKACHDVYREKS